MNQVGSVARRPEPGYGEEPVLVEPLPLVHDLAIAVPERHFEISDGTGALMVTADLAWPDGIQPGRNDAVAFLLTLEPDPTVGPEPYLDAWLVDRERGGIPEGLVIEPGVDLDTTWGELEGLGAVFEPGYGTWSIGGLIGELDGPTVRATPVRAFGAGATGLLGC